ncbi:MAG: hypothetical protein ACLRVT_00480 [Oscillospiraceae bacterium]
MSEEMEFGPDLMTLLDEEGNEHEFEVADTLEDNEQALYGTDSCFRRR